MVDFELSLTDSGTIALYTGTNIDALTQYDASVTGSIAPNAWIHGRSIVVVSDPVLFMKLCPIIGLVSVFQAGISELLIVRLTIVKLQ